MAELKTIGSVPVKNMANPAGNVFTGGQPTKAQLKTLAERGVKHVINLRPADEQSWNEAEYAQSLGLNYHSIPVAGADDITAVNAGLLQSTLTQIGDDVVLLHCASGNRVGALVALNEGLKTGDIDAAINTGRKWGLGGLAPAVKDKLGE